ncbi:VOC family protein [Rubellimicrobium roseum]|uniref:VOC family protein n=1 Tax=Rubellimicrobium roseum TaxID=687525 RepID=A0A5C4NEZ8_9RHOB|nr:VOC family protein [Rubellimicrobium roseum]TNC69822.1 VOC family protein [Rubellimicrobium roseum]
MPTIPYLHFRGDCAEALAFYAGALGGTDLALLRYADSPNASEAAKGSDRVMHGQLRLGDGMLMASDVPPGMEGHPQQGVSVMQTFPEPAAAHQAFDRLTDGGTVIQPFAPTFFSRGFGMVRDRFGTHWIISTAPEAASQSADPAAVAETEAHPT